jgi:hypothetical protein
LVERIAEATPASHLTQGRSNEDIPVKQCGCFIQQKQHVLLTSIGTCPQSSPDSARSFTLSKPEFFRTPVRAHPGGSERRGHEVELPPTCREPARRRYCITARHHFPSCCDFISSHKYQTHHRVITKIALLPNQTGNVTSTSSKGYWKYWTAIVSTFKSG